MEKSFVIAIFHIIKSKKIAVIWKFEAWITITWRIEAGIWEDRGVSAVNGAYLVV